MNWDVKKVEPLPDYRLYVEIADGRNGIFDMKPYLDRPPFRRLADVGYFNQVGIVFGAVTWPDDQDIAPETLLVGLQPSDGQKAEQEYGRLPEETRVPSIHAD